MAKRSKLDCESTGDLSLFLGVCVVEVPHTWRIVLCNVVVFVWALWDFCLSSVRLPSSMGLIALY